jgi:MFS family permease
MMAQQLCGINSVVMYSVDILQDVMPGKAALITVMVSGINVIGTLSFSPLADKIGRKPCLLLSTIGMGLASAMLAAGLAEHSQLLSVLGFTFFVCSFSIGLGPIPFLLPSELVGPEAVGIISSCALGGNWFANFMVAQFFPMVNASLPRGQVFWIFAGISAFFATVILLCVPESKGAAHAGEVWDNKR